MTAEERHDQDQLAAEFDAGRAGRSSSASPLSAADEPFSRVHKWILQVRRCRGGPISVA